MGGRPSFEPVAISTPRLALIRSIVPSAFSTRTPPREIVPLPRTELIPLPRIKPSTPFRNWRTTWFLRSPTFL